MDGNEQRHESSSSGNSSPPVNGTGMLAKLLNQLNLPTLAAIMLMGGGNFFVTKEDGRLTREDQVKVVREVHDLHQALNGFEARQKESLQNQAQLIRGQTAIIQNQLDVLKRIGHEAPPKQ